MDSDPRIAAARDSAEFRSFAVEAFVGRRASGWPFARFDINSRELRVRLPFPWFTTRSQEATAITAVVIGRRLGGMWCVRFDDAAGNLNDVHVHPLVRRQAIIGELHSCGYHVVDDQVPTASR
jgi:hypothetical protein